MRIKGFFTCSLLALCLSGCVTPSGYVNKPYLEEDVTLGTALKYCRDTRENYRKAVKQTDRLDQASGAAVVLAGLGGLYEGVTGGSSRAITNYAVAGTLAYTGQQFFIRRPTRVEIYNAGISQMNCVLSGAPSSASPAWLANPNFKLSNGKFPKSVSELAAHLTESINRQQYAIKQNQCTLPKTITTLETKKSQVLKVSRAAERVASKVFGTCDSVAVQVSNAINSDTPNSNDIRAFLSGVSFSSAGESTIDPPPDPAILRADDDGGRCENARSSSEALVHKTQLFLDLAGASMQTLETDCVSQIVPQGLRIAGSSPYNVAKDGSELKIKIIGGVDPLVVQQQVAKSGAPTVALEDATRSIKVTTTGSTEAGAYGFSLIDANGSAAQFVIAVTDG